MMIMMITVQVQDKGKTSFYIFSSFKITIFFFRNYRSDYRHSNPGRYNEDYEPRRYQRNNDYEPRRYQRDHQQTYSHDFEDSRDSSRPSRPSRYQGYRNDDKFDD